MSRLYLVRHGQASFGSENYDQLSELGVAQCRRLAEHWREIGREVNWVASGSLQRQLQSARSFQAARGADPGAIRAVAGLEEYDHRNVLQAWRDRPGYVAATEGPTDRKQFHRELTAALQAWTQGELPGAVPYAAFRERCVAALQGILTSLGAGESVVVFGSAGSLAAALQPVLGLGDSAAMQLKLNFYNSSVSSLLYDGQRATLESLNSIAHLEHPDFMQLVTHR